MTETNKPRLNLALMDIMDPPIKVLPEGMGNSGSYIVFNNEPLYYFPEEQTELAVSIANQLFNMLDIGYENGLRDALLCPELAKSTLGEDPISPLSKDIPRITFSKEELTDDNEDEEMPF